MGCRHAAGLDRLVALGELERPSLDDPMSAMVGRFGLEHEERHLEGLRTGGKRVVEIAPGRSVAELEAAEEATAAAMADGADVIFQATFYSPPWRGHCDFLLRVESPSQFGAWSYEPADAKLHAKATEDDWLQLAFHARQVERLQGVSPSHLHVISPGGMHTAEARPHLERLDRTMGELLAFVEDPPVTEPEPVPMCDRCGWRDRCRGEWIERDHLSLAGVGARQRPKLRAGGIGTVTALAAMADDAEVDGMEQSTLRRLRSDARLVLHERRTNQPHMRLRYPRPGKGLAALPEPHPRDIYIDLEGFQFAAGGPLEYLFGLFRAEDPTEESFRSFWAHDQAGEGQAFAVAIDFLVAEASAHPGLHVYHYNSYEPSAFRRLAQRHQTRHDEVASLCDGVLVDLLPIARYSVRSSSLSASLKSLEVFYRAGRSGDVIHAAGSMVAYDEWCRGGSDEILRQIEHYNREDCESLAELHAWLESLSTEVSAVADDEGVGDDDSGSVTPLERAVAALDLAVGTDAGDSAWRRARRALVAAEFALEHLPAEPFAALLGRAELEAQLLLGKKELGIPISVTDLAGGRR